MATERGLQRLLIVTPRYFPYMGGTETHVHEVGQRLARAGFAVTVVTTDPSHRLPLHEEVEGMHIRRVPSWPKKEDYYFAPRIYRIVKQGNWDLIHFQGCHTLVPPFGMLAARRAKIPYVVTFHGVGAHSSLIRSKLRGVQYAVLRSLLLQAHQLVGVSQHEAEVFSKRLGVTRERIAVIPNGIHIPQPTDPSAPTDDYTLIASVGRLERFKGHHRVIEAMPKVLEQRHNVHLLILGAGPYEPELWRLATSLRVADRVEIRAIPAGDRAGMASQLSQAALVVLLSESESHPVAVMEALALRRPVLVADSGGFRELAQKGLVRAISLRSTPDEVAAAVLHQLDEPPVPVSVAMPTWDDCTARLISVYEAIVRRSLCAS
jgi:glycosyltransferase involved in cell wall biosynthesis